MTEQDKNALQDSFKNNVDKLTDIEYRHPAEQELLVSLRLILKKSATAEHLLHMAEQYKVPFHVIKHKDIQGFTPDKKTVILSAPEGTKAASPAFVLEAVAALREIEQEIIGYKRPPPHADPLEFAAMSHAKNLDIIVHMCKTVHELSADNDASEYIATLKKMGHEGLYEAYIHDFSPEKMADRYYGKD